MDNRRTSSSAPATAEMALRGLRLAVLTKSGRGAATRRSQKMKRLDRRRPDHGPKPLSASDHLRAESPSADGHQPSSRGCPTTAKRYGERLRVIPFDVFIPERERDKGI